MRSRASSLRALAGLLLFTCLVALASALVPLPVHGQGKVAKGTEIGHAPDFRIDPLAVERAKAEERAQRRERETPQARARRQRSRGAYAGQSAADALVLAKQKHPALLRRPLGKLLQLEDGQRLVRWSGRHAAVVEADGRQEVVDSMLPLRDEDAAGELAPVDLDLETAGEGFAVRQPLVPVRVADAPGAQSAVGKDGVKVRPLEGAADVEPRLSDGRVYWANAKADTDVLAMPTPAGLEVAYVLRSAKSPEALSLGIDLPSGVVATRDWEAAKGIVLRRDGKKVGFITAPIAQDASGKSVDVSFSLEYGRLAMRVDHRDQDLEYPIAVDPEIGFDHISDWGHNMREGWSENNVAGTWKYSWWDVGGGPGLNIWRDAWWNPDGLGHRGDWYRTVPGHSYISGVHFFNISWWLADTCIHSFVQRYAGGSWPNLADFHYCRSGPTTNHGPFHVGRLDTRERVHDKNYVVLALTTAYHGGQRGFTLGRWGGIKTYYGDDYGPEQPGGNFPNVWVNPNTADRDWQLGANDYGVGMKRIEWRGEWDSAVQTDWDGCTGGWDHFCNTNDMGPHLRGHYNPNGNHTMTRRHAGVPDGNWPVHANYIDLVNNATGWRHVGNVKVDTIRPSIATSGDVKEGPLPAGDYELRIDPSDPTPPGASHSARVASGIDDVKVYVDDALHFSDPADGGHTRAWVWNTEATGLGEGSHNVRVVAKDKAGNERTDAFTVVVDYHANYNREMPGPGGEAEDGSVGEGGWPACEPDPGMGGDYCGENDEGDPDLDAADTENRSLSDPAVSMLDGTRSTSAFSQQMSSSRRVLYGLSDQNGLTQVNPIDDPRFRDLLVPRIRRVVGFDVVSRAQDAAKAESTRLGRTIGASECGLPACGELRRLNDFMKAARRGPIGRNGSPVYANGLEVLTSFGTNFARMPRNKPIPENAPDPATTYRSAVGRFRAYYAGLHDQFPDRWPRLKFFTAWNEPEIRSISYGELTRYKSDGAKGPEIAAAYLRQLAAVCGQLEGGTGRCRAVAADTTDSRDILADYRDSSGTRRPGYFRRYKAGLKGYRPKIWGFHGYRCADDRNFSFLRQLAKGTRNTTVDGTDDPALWITEAGAGLTFHRNGQPNPNVRQRPAEYDQAMADATGDLEYLVSPSGCAAASPRFNRVYVYQWAGDIDFDGDDADTATDRDASGGLRYAFDTGLTDVYTSTGVPSATERYATRPTYDVFKRFSNPNNATP